MKKVQIIVCNSRISQGCRLQDPWGGLVWFAIHSSKREKKKKKKRKGKEKGVLFWPDQRSPPLVLGRAIQHVCSTITHCISLLSQTLPFDHCCLWSYACSFHSNVAVSITVQRWYILVSWVPEIYLDWLLWQLFVYYNSGCMETYL